MQSDSAAFDRHLVTAAIQRLAQTVTKHPVALRKMHDRQDLQRLLSLARQEASQLDGQRLATVTWALADLKCNDGTLYEAIAGEARWQCSPACVVCSKHYCTGEVYLVAFLSVELPKLTLSTLPSTSHGLDELPTRITSAVLPSCAARALTLLTFGEHGFTTSDLVKLTLALRRSKQPAR